MDVFEFRDRLVGDYRDFTRSFIQPKAKDICTYLDQEYDSGHYWPSPLIQINPSYVSAGNVDALAREERLTQTTADIFRFNKSASSSGVPAELYMHQLQAIECCKRLEPYVLTTGTGSGKSLSYFIPMVDAILNEKHADPTPRIQAIVIYPMNALANSQQEELEKFLSDFPKDKRPISYARYTGQESQEERESITNPWSIKFSRLFDMSNDSNLFATHQQLDDQGARLQDNHFYLNGTRYLPLYEAKMVHHYDHRFATYATDGETIRDTTVAEKQQPDYAPLPRYWVEEREVLLRTADLPKVILDGFKNQDTAKLDEGLRTWLAGQLLVREQMDSAMQLLGSQVTQAGSTGNLFERCCQFTNA